MSSTPLPNFFIVGAPKAGTSSLHAWLRQHPQVFLPELKEPDFFTWQAIDAQQMHYGATDSTETREAYLELFANAGSAKAIGEASVSYLYYPHTAQAIHDFNPQARILVLLRDPVNRAISHYKMDARLGYVKHSLESIFRGTTGHAQQENWFQQYFKLGQYAGQIQRYASVFDAKQLLVLLPGKELKEHLPDILSFLGVEAEVAEAPQANENVAGEAKSGVVRKLYQLQGVRKFASALVPAGAKKALRNQLFDKSAPDPVSDEFRAELKAWYQSDVEQLASLLGHSCWDY